MSSECPPVKECFHIHVALVPKKEICSLTCAQKWFARNLWPKLLWNMILFVKNARFGVNLQIEQQNRPLFKNNTGCFGHTDNDELITRPRPKAPSHQGCDSEQGGSLDLLRASAGPKKRGNKSCKFKSFHRWKIAMQVVKYSAVSSLHHIFWPCAWIFRYKKMPDAYCDLLH